jgi:hypothetical protein
MASDLLSKKIMRENFSAVFFSSCFSLPRVKVINLLNFK